jgi:hypothetical protein
MARPHKGPCTYEQSKRGAYEACTQPNCKERFPCAGNDCGHMDCIERRGTLPKCHYCGKKVEGKKDDRWTAWAVHGKTRAVHYTCRNAVASPTELARWGEPIGKAQPESSEPTSTSSPVCSGQ